MLTLNKIDSNLFYLLCRLVSSLLRHSLNVYYLFDLLVPVRMPGSRSYKIIDQHKHFVIKSPLKTGAQDLKR